MVCGVPQSQTRLSYQIRELSHFTDEDDEISGTKQLTQGSEPRLKSILWKEDREATPVWWGTISFLTSSQRGSSV